MQFPPQFGNVPYPGYPQQMPVQRLPQAQMQMQNWAPAPQRPPQGQGAPQNWAAAPQPAPPSQPRPIVRAQSPDEPMPPSRPRVEKRRVSLSLPAPESLGIRSGAVAATPAATPREESVDWTMAHRRLDRVGATSFQKDRTAKGYRMTCLMPTGQPGRNHRVEAEAVTEAEALRLMLDRAEQWMVAKR